jgi:hypothetical protein
MANTEKGKPYKHNTWVNPVILAIFLSFRFGVSPLLGWQVHTAYTIVWFTLFVAVFILVNYFLYFRPYLRWKKSAKTAFRT